MKLMLIAALISLSCTAHAEDFRQWSPDAADWLGKKPTRHHTLSVECRALRFDKPHARSAWSRLLRERARLATAVRGADFGGQLRIHRAMAPLVKSLTKRWFRMPTRCRWVAPVIVADL